MRSREDNIMRRMARLLLLLAAATLPGGAWAAADAPAPGGEAGNRAVRNMPRQARGRVFSALGPTMEADLARLREALVMVPEAGSVELSPLPTGAAVRVSGPAAAAAVTAAGKSAGFTLRLVTGYVVSGPSTAADLARLQAALSQAGGVEAVEMRALTGGATLRISGDAGLPVLVTAAKGAGYTLWPLNEGAGLREFRIAGDTSPSQQKLTSALRQVMGIGQVEIRTAPDGPHLVIAGGRARPDAIFSAATAAGVTLTPITRVDLPSLEPRAGRDTPPDFDEWVMEELTRPGEPAPDFALLSQDGQTTLRLSDSRGKKPVVLMFGSCT